MNQELYFRTLQETKHWTQKWGLSLERPTVVLLSGSMGAGKTQLVKWVVEALGGKDVSSPTFAVHLCYSCNSGDVDHFDLYRIENFQELEGVGLWDALNKPNALVFVEWSNRLDSSAWPTSLSTLEIEIQAVSGSEERRIVVRSLGRV